MLELEDEHARRSNEPRAEEKEKTERESLSLTAAKPVRSEL